VVGGHDHVGLAVQPVLAQRAHQRGEIVVGVADAGEGGLAADAGEQPAEAVALIALRAVRVARPEHHRERTAA
jgi:hypothetical protein